MWMALPHPERESALPMQRAAGVAGMLAGVGLTLELLFFTLSGWTPTAFDASTTALELFRSGGTYLRAAALVGFINLALAVVWIAGLASRLSRSAPISASASLYLALLGMSCHALVPVGLWLGVPGFLALAARDARAVTGSWPGFAAVIDAAGGAGYFFEGLALIAAGLGLRRQPTLPAGLAWVAIAAGIASTSTLLTEGTPLAAIGGAAFLPALLLTIAFRCWSGHALWRRGADASDPPSAETLPPAPRRAPVARVDPWRQHL